MATKDVLIDVQILPTLAENKNKENVKPPGFLTIEDAYLDREGALRKRDGAVQDTIVNLASRIQPRWTASYNGDTVVGTTDGVYQEAGGAAPYNNNEGGDYDAVVDHSGLSGLPIDAVEMDSAVVGSRLFVAFTYAPAALLNPANIIATDVWYAVYDAATFEMVKSPQVIATGTDVSRPRVVVSSTSVSFWWIDNGSARYTLGVPVVTASVPGGLVVFTVNTLSAATDVSWCACPTLSGGVFVATILGGTILPVTFTNASMTTATLLTAYTFSSRLHRFVEVIYAPSSLTGGSDSVYACGYEGSSADGIFSVARYNTTPNTWTASAPQSFFYASPTDTLNGYAVPLTEYQQLASRVTLGFSEATTPPRLCIWGTCYYTMALNSLTVVPPGAFVKDGVGCCTTLASLSVDSSGIVFPIRQSAPIFTYAVATKALRPTGRNVDAVGLVRSGIANTIEFWVDVAPANQDFVLQSTVGELFSSCVFVVPATRITEASPIVEVAPIFKAFDLRVSESWNRTILQNVGNEQWTVVRRMPFSVARTYLDETTAKVCALTKPSGALSASTDAEKAIEIAVINMLPEARPSVEENGVLFGRNVTSSFDGALTSESSIIDVPLMSVAADTATATYTNANVPSPVGPGVFFKTVYSFTDGKGNKHRSSPTGASAPWGTAVTPNAAVALGVWDRPLSSRKLGLLEQTTIELYRASDPTSGIFEKGGVASFLSGERLEEAPHILAFSTADFRAGNVNLSGENLYTEGGVLESQCPPSLKDVESGKGRMWGLTDDKLFYTKPIEERVAPEWNYALTLDIPDDTGTTTGIGSMDDKVVAFTERGTYVVYGDGPNALGTGGTFAQLLRIPGNIGCIARGSIVECPLGIAFLSQQGFYLLDRGLNLTFIGKPVESSVDALIRLGLPHTIVSAVHDIGNKHVRFIVDSSMPGIGDMKRDHYVWYYESNQWGRFTSFNELQSVYSRGRVVSLFDRGVNMNTGLRTIQTTIEQDETSEYGTFVAPLKMKARTGWIDLGNIDGFERVKRFNFLYSPGFDPFNPNTTRQGINVKLYSQFRTTPEDSTHTWDQSDLVSMQAPIDYAGEFSVQPKIQKCASMSIEFEEIENLVAPLTYQGTEVAGLTMRIGKRAGVSKMNIALARRK